MIINHIPTPEEIKRASLLTRRDSHDFNSLTIMKGNLDAKFSGYLGEVCFAEYLRSYGLVVDHHAENAKASDSGIYGHDMTCSGLKFEIKTKERAVPVKPNYEMTVSVNSIENFKPDIYVGISVYWDKSGKDVVQMIGWIPRIKYDLSHMQSQDSGNGFVNPNLEPAYFLQYGNLMALDTLVDYLISKK